jgi:hypothetical protein
MQFIFIYLYIMNIRLFYKTLNIYYAINLLKKYFILKIINLNLIIIQNHVIKINYQYE